MSLRDFKQREYDCFISYGSEDASIASSIAVFVESCGLSVFIDDKKFYAATEVDEGLAEKMQQSKACIVLLNSGSINKPYVKEELRLARQEAVKYPEFRLVVAVLEDNFDPGSYVSGLGVRSWLSLVGGELNIANARNLLLALRVPETLPRQDQPQIYVSCSWRDYETHPRDQVLALMKSQGAFLVGDSRDQRSFQEGGTERIERIMSGCSGFLGIYPDRQERGKSASDLYNYFPEELRIARKLGLVERIYCGRLDALPDALKTDWIVELNSEMSSNEIKGQVISFLDDAGTRQPHSFLGTNFKQLQDRNEAAKDIVENLLGMKCYLGREVLGSGLRVQIRSIIEEANLVIADLACSFEDDSDNLRININTCIEAGIAFAHEKPLFLTALDVSCRVNTASKTASIPFFFRDHSIEWYQDDIGFLANVYRIAFNRRRRILNAEID